MKSNAGRAGSGWFFWWVLLVVSAPKHGQTQSMPATPPEGVQIKVTAQPSKATVGDRIRIDFDISHPRGYQIQIPDPGETIGDFSILEFLPGPEVPGPDRIGNGAGPATEASGKEIAHHRARIVAALFRTGNFSFPPIQIVMRTPNGKTIFLSSPTAGIEIQSVLTDEDPELRGLKKQAEIQEHFRWLQRLIFILPALVLAAIVWRIWRRRRRDRYFSAGALQADPLASAEAELRDLLGRCLPDEDQVKPFYVKLSEIMKRILEAGYGIQARERTTAEILAELHLRSASLPVQINLEPIEGLLSGCDLVKFARYTPSPAENESAAARAVQILKSCKQMKSAPAIPGPASMAGAS